MFTILPQASLGLVFTVITVFLFCRLARTKAYSAWQDAKKTFFIQIAGTITVQIVTITISVSYSTRKVDSVYHFVLLWLYIVAVYFFMVSKYP